MKSPHPLRVRVYFTLKTLGEIPQLVFKYTIKSANVKKRCSKNNMNCPRKLIEKLNFNLLTNNTAIQLNCVYNL